MASATSSDLKTYLDLRCIELKLDPISANTIKILEDNEIDKTILFDLDDTDLEKLNILLGSLKKLMHIVNADKAKRNMAATSSSSPARSDTVTPSPINSSSPPANQINNKNKISTQVPSLSIDDDDDDAEFQQALALSAMDNQNQASVHRANGNDDENIQSNLSSETDEQMAKRLQDEEDAIAARSLFDDKDRSSDTSFDRLDGFFPNQMNGDALLQALADAKTPTAFRDAAQKIHFARLFSICTRFCITSHR